MPIKRQRRPGVKMEMTPLIDCVFLLLIFFMLSSSFVTPTIELTLPIASAAAEPAPQPIVITLADDGEVYINRESIEFRQLQEKLSELLEGSKDKSVTIRGDKNMKYDFFVRALDAAKSSGAVHVNIAHQFDK